MWRHWAKEDFLSEVTLQVSLRSWTDQYTDQLYRELGRRVRKCDFRQTMAQISKHREGYSRARLQQSKAESGTAGGGAAGGAGRTRMVRWEPRKDSH